jgi:hypothetical protein
VEIGASKRVKHVAERGHHGIGRFGHFVDGRSGGGDLPHVLSLRRRVESA